ncbi:MAG TPA: hypothetical protein VIE42_00860 [Steroidobacteraceae bacterium]|jgi:hypothetical protein
MKNQRPWQPRLSTLPLLDPFDRATEWTAERDGDDRIEIAAAEETEDSVPADTAQTPPTEPRA